MGFLGQAKGSGHSASAAGTDVLRTGVCFMRFSIQGGCLDRRLLVRLSYIPCGMYLLDVAEGIRYMPNGMYMRTHGPQG